MTVTAQLIKELRDRTGVGMGKCKDALVESNGDIELAIKNLRKSGAASAVKKEGRTTSEGIIGIAQNEGSIAIVEVNAETDFVVNNERFQDFVKAITSEALKGKATNLNEFLAQPYSADSTLSIDQYRGNMVQTIGENIQISRLKILKKGSNSSFGIYSHHSGKIACIVQLDGSAAEEDFAKEIAMHVAAAAPQFLCPDCVPEELIQQEKEIARNQVKGKPEAILEKIFENKMQAFFGECCLIQQKYVKDESTTIEQLVSKRAKDAGKPLAISDFVRWSVGQKS